MICIVVPHTPECWPEDGLIISRNKILIFIHCCVLTVILKHFVLVLELKHNGMSSIKKLKICSLQMQTLYSVTLRDPCLRITKDL